MILAGFIDPTISRTKMGANSAAPKSPTLMTKPPNFALTAPSPMEIIEPANPIDAATGLAGRDEGAGEVGSDILFSNFQSACGDD